ncbi:MAG TPA: hypothetical protein VFV81_03995, partial [Verrucomicrobiae bacterium]|nr:hypothetical protein [Verrucomicrobiae bacterium]
VGGQYLGAVTNVVFGGQGINASVIEYRRPMNQKEFNDLRDELKKLQNRRTGPRRLRSGTNSWTAADEARLAEIRDKILKNAPNRQGNPAMAETVLLKITIAPGAAPGENELRLQTPAALSNPQRFIIGPLPETSKPAAKSTNPDLARLLERLGGSVVTNTTRTEMRVTLPTTVNGQILPGGVDRWWFSGRSGQRLVISVSARSLIPYLADAVPGWFEATATIYDAQGKEMAYDDRFRFRPDPVICFDVPRSGNYCVEIHDSIYRGREDFVYRMTIGELPFVTDIFPLGGPAGEKTTVTATGWNLARTQWVFNAPDEPGIFSMTNAGEDNLNLPKFAVDTLPECRAAESNGSPATAQTVTLPLIINGRIASPGATPTFEFAGRAGETVVAEVLARRLGSPLDSTLELADAAGKRLAFNDDFDDEGSGLETHHADSCLTATLPADGKYFIRLADVQQQGGPAYSYRLRLSGPRPDFALRVAPSSLSLRAGMSVPATVYVIRRDGFTNAIDLDLRGGSPEFSLSGARIAAGQGKVQLTIKASPQAQRLVTGLVIEGRAVIGGREMIHAAVPAEDMMQAFAYRHLVPSHELAVAVANNPRPFAAATLKILDPTPIKIPMGGTARVRVATPSAAFANRFDFELGDAPEAITLAGVSPSAAGMEMVLECSRTNISAGASGNLIVNLLPKASAKAPAAGKNRQRKPVGALPAIPFEIVSE